MEARGFSASLNLSDLNGSNGFCLAGAGTNTLHSGYSAASAGDINGDGFDDILVGAPHGTVSETFVVFGKASGFSANIELRRFDGNDGFRLVGDENGQSGHSVASAGDINGDGYNDIIIGAPRFNQQSGASYIVFGKAGGWTADLDLAGLDGNNGFRLNGMSTDGVSPGFGASVASAGDINGDGFDDIIVGAPSSDTTFVVFGKAERFDASIDVSSLDGTSGFSIGRLSPNEQSGCSVASAGDVNGDGLDDIIIGARLADSGGIDASGASYVVFGRLDGFAAFLDPTKLTGTDGFRLYGGKFQGLSGGSVAAAGDVNGDGLDDILIGAPGVGGASETYVVFGRAVWGPLQFDGTETADNLYGGEWNDSIGGLGGDDTIDGGLGNDRIRGGDGNDLLRGSQGSDTLRGGPGDDIILGNAGRDVLTGNSGRDVFKFIAIADSRLDAPDTISDFNVDSVAPDFIDRIDLSKIDAIPGLRGNQAFEFLGIGFFTADGQIRATQESDGSTLIEINTTGTVSTPEMAIILTDFTANNLTAGDFIL